MFRAKLHKNAKYFDELMAENVAARASEAVLQAQNAEREASQKPIMAYDRACGILDAFKAAAEAKQ